MLKRIVIAGLLAMAVLPARGVAAPVLVAVAANFTKPSKEIAAAFKAATGEDVLLSFGASGQFYTQITHGAPYQVFLSADIDRALKAEQDGVGVPGTRFTYATGWCCIRARPGWWTTGARSCGGRSASPRSPSPTPPRPPTARRPSRR